MKCVRCSFDISKLSPNGLCPNCVVETGEKIEGKKRIAQKLPVDVTLEELLKIMQVSRMKHHRLAYFIAWYTGSRISEVLNLEPRDINWKDKTMLIRQGKNSKDRIVRLPRDFIEPMTSLMPLKNIIKPRALQKAFKKDCLNAGILAYKPSVHFHSLRHGFATHCLEKGMEIQNIQMLLGHADISMTMRYAHVRPIKALNQQEEKFYG